MVLQFVTIFVSYLISNSIFFTKTKSIKKTYANDVEIESKKSNHSYIPRNKPPEKTYVKKDSSEISHLLRDELKKIFTKERQELIEHLEFNLGDLRQILNDSKNENISNSFQFAIKKTERGINHFKKISNPINYSMDFGNYIILHTMILDKLNNAKIDYENSNQLIDIDKFINELVKLYYNKTKSYKLNKTDYRNQ